MKTAGHDSSHHIVPGYVYRNVLILLLVLTVLTVAAARFDFGALNAVVAMLIASLKAYLVLAYFMGLKYDEKTNLLVFLSAVFFLILLFAFSFMDIVTRVAPAPFAP